VPLAAFRGVDLRNVESIALMGLSQSGDLTIGDLSFQR
jgi:hypothetical protein